LGATRPLARSRARTAVRPSTTYNEYGARSPADTGSAYQARIDTSRKLRNHIRQIKALGFDVTITKAV
jgi:hypothetical protein